ncbi:hypothetical protein HSRCO_0256 [Halanaeroarchaeum sp. HSR-CO]|nr:hypothetical protein HSRCO_0256 [Halanaeroarchaeum sp. HSR-CO]
MRRGVLTRAKRFGYRGEQATRGAIGRLGHLPSANPRTPGGVSHSRVADPVVTISAWRPVARSRYKKVRWPVSDPS